ncbi:hypothetical protein HQQ80_17810 [Microbacteriaceae bacterium VKM Ac-2855]|nr:hypothetical protein [Microbacteriaceae bacterium VKM Ac-2855]
MSAFIAVALTLAPLTGCAGTAEARSPAPTTTVTVTATPSAAPSTGGDTSASYACGRYSSLLSLGWTTQWHHQQGELDDDAYAQFLARQAFQLTTVTTTDPALTAAKTAVTTYLKDTPPTPQGWTYDPDSAEWGSIISDLGAACTAAGTELASWAEPGMGG